MDILDNVTDPQRAAITHIEGPLLVLAGAGSGKTLAITRRIAHLIEAGVPPSSILAITFTNKAAGEMKERVARLTRNADVWLSTFHSFGARLLRQHAERLGFTRSFTIYDTTDQLDCIKEAMRALEIDTTQWRPPAIAAHISHQKNMMTPLEELAGGDLFDQIVYKVFARYRETLQTNNALDFDDLLLMPLRLFQEHPDVLAYYQNRFRFVLIDEYQDTNRPQYLLAKKLSEGHRNICVTGDPDQSIYRWRGADIHNILNFEEDFPGGEVVKLEENFRSTGKILEAASGLITHNRHRKDKRMWTRNGDGELVRIVFVADERHEAKVVARRIRNEIDEGRAASDIAVFFRTNALSRSLEYAMIDQTIPYTIVGSVEFFRRREVKDVIAYLRVRNNPADSTSLERVLNIPRRGIGQKSLAALKEYAWRAGAPLMHALREHGAVPGLTRRVHAGIESFLEIIDALSDAPDSPVAPLFRQTLELTQYENYLAQTESRREADRIDNVNELVSAALDFDLRNPEGTLSEFLEEVALISDTDKWEQDEPRVTLMTMHSAKGLEFPVVYIVGVEEGMLPHQRSIDSDDEIEEERRLLHVGMTRAMEQLTLLHASARTTFGGAEPRLPSRFLQEIPPEAVEHENLFESPGPYGTDSFGSYSETWDAAAADIDPGIDPATEAAAAGAGNSGAAEGDLEPGDVVQHEYFGIGTIVSMLGDGQQQRAVVQFESGDERTLILQYAKLCRLI